MTSPSTDPHTRTWFLDEVANAGDEHFDRAHVERFDRKSQFDVTAELDVLRALDIGPAPVVVDLGAGTGAFAVAAAPFAAEVIAVDVAPMMMEHLRARVREHGLDNVRIVEAGFLTYEHAGRPADVVFTRHALHHLPDFWKAVALGRMWAMLRPGGVLRIVDLIFSFPPERAAEVLDAWVAGGVDDPEQGWTREELAVHLRDEHSTFTWLFESMLERAGFTIESASYAGDEIYAAYTCRRSAGTPR